MIHADFMEDFMDYEQADRHNACQQMRDRIHGEHRRGYPAAWSSAKLTVMCDCVNEAHLVAHFFPSHTHLMGSTCTESMAALKALTYRE